MYFYLFNNSILKNDPKTYETVFDELCFEKRFRFKLKVNEEINFENKQKRIIILSCEEISIKDECSRLSSLIEVIN